MLLNKSLVSFPYTSVLLFLVFLVSLSLFSLAYNSPVILSVPPLTYFPFPAEDLRVTRPWEHWPSHLVLPMMLMRENMKHSMLQSLNSSASSLDLSVSSKPRNRSSLEGGGFVCGDCGRTYKLKSSLRNHQKWECGKEPQFKCPYCVYKAKQKMHMARHMERMHREIDYASIKAEIKTEPGEPKQESNEERENQPSGGNVSEVIAHHLNVNTNSNSNTSN